MKRFEFPKIVPELTKDQKIISDKFMKLWLEHIQKKDIQLWKVSIIIIRWIN